MTDVQEHLLTVVRDRRRGARQVRRGRLPHPRAQPPGLPGSTPLHLGRRQRRGRRAHPGRRRRCAAAPPGREAPAVPGRGHPGPTAVPGRLAARPLTPCQTGGVSERLVFDGDCGFCTTSANWLARGDRVETVPWQFLDLESVGLTVDQVSTLGVVAGRRPARGALVAGHRPRPSPARDAVVLGGASAAGAGDATAGRRGLPGGRALPPPAPRRHPRLPDASRS